MCTQQANSIRFSFTLAAPLVILLYTSMVTDSFCQVFHSGIFFPCWLCRIFWPLEIRHFWLLQWKPAFPFTSLLNSHSYKTHQFFLFVFPLPIYYIIVDLTLRKSTSGTNYCSLAEVAESPASQQWRSRIPLVWGVHQERQKLSVKGGHWHTSQHLLVAQRGMLQAGLCNPRVKKHHETIKHPL